MLIDLLETLARGTATLPRQICTEPQRRVLHHSSAMCKVEFQKLSRSASLYHVTATLLMIPGDGKLCSVQRI